MKVSIEMATAAPKRRSHLARTPTTAAALLRIAGSQVDDLGTGPSRQAYVIRCTHAGVLVACTTAQGLFYGVQTLASYCAPPTPQKRRLPSPPRHPRLAEHEWRGVSDDISRGPIPSLAYLKTQIRTLAEYKINLVGFNMEHCSTSRPSRWSHQEIRRKLH